MALGIISSLLFPSWRLTGISIITAAVIGGVGGFRLADTLSAAEEQKAVIAEKDHQIFDLQQKMKGQAEILEEDATTAQANSEAIATLMEQKNDLEKQIGTRACFSSADVDRLRQFWGATDTSSVRPAKARKGLSRYRPW